MIFDAFCVLVFIAGVVGLIYAFLFFWDATFRG